MNSKPTKVPKGFGKVYYLQHREFIVEQLKLGYTVAEIHRVLKSQSSSANLLSYRQLLSLIYKYDHEAGQIVAYQNNGNFYKRDQPQNSPPPVMVNVTNVTVDKPSSKIGKPKTFTYNPRALTDEDLFGDP